MKCIVHILMLYIEYACICDVIYYYFFNIFKQYLNFSYNYLAVMHMLYMGNHLLAFVTVYHDRGDH